MNSFERQPRKGYGFIYMYTSPSGKKYIGQTIKSLKERAKTKSGVGYKDCTLFYRAIQKYEFSSFTYEILEECLIEELDEKEIYFIKKYNSKAPNGYNSTEGGKNAWREKSEARKHKIYQYDLNGNFIREFESLVQAAKYMKTSYQSISAVLQRKRPQHNGYIYRYPNEDKPEPITVKKTGGRRTAQYTLNNELIAIYPSANQAALAIGKDSNAGRNIRMVCQGKRNTAYGFKWKFLD